jgi:hypothetical protein
MVDPYQHRPLIPLPKIPKSNEELIPWAEQFTRAIQQFFLNEAFRLEDIIQKGMLGERPEATGSRRFYYATDTHQLFFDDGTWILISSAAFGEAWEEDAQSDLMPATPPADSVAWVRDSMGDLMLQTSPTTDSYWEADSNDDWMPKAA